MEWQYCDFVRAQLQKHKTLYGSTSSYSRQISTEASDLSPLTVLRTAIQLHQRHPREESSADSVPKRAKPEPPLLQPEIPLSSASPDFEEKLDHLKKVLPSASEVKLAF